MNEAETRAEHVDPALAAAGWGIVIATRGLDAAIRGVRVGALRPDLVIIDDPETRYSVQSEPQTTKRVKTIEQDLAGLGGPGCRLARVMLTTCMRRESISYEYTSREIKPAWRGRRYRWIEQFPIARISGTSTSSCARRTRPPAPRPDRSSAFRSHKQIECGTTGLSPYPTI